MKFSESQGICAACVHARCFVCQLLPMDFYGMMLGKNFQCIFTACPHILRALSHTHTHTTTHNGHMRALCKHENVFCCQQSIDVRRRGTEQQVYNTLGALLTSTLFMGILNSIFVQPVVGNERTVFYRERAAGMYSVAPWYLAMVGPASHHATCKTASPQSCVDAALLLTSLRTLCWPISRMAESLNMSFRCNCRCQHTFCFA